MSGSSNSESDLIALASSVAQTHYNAPSVSCRLHDEQGEFSKTYIVELEDQLRTIVQFRDTPLDLSLYDVAYGVADFGFPTFSKHIYIMNYIDGEMWTSALGAWPGAWEDDAAIAGQLGRALSHCIVGPDSSEVVESYIIPRLQSVLHENIPPDRPELRKSVEQLIAIAPKLKKLPLSLSHVDLNATNVGKTSVNWSSLPNHERDRCLLRSVDHHN
ncbi:hypothetical protein K435DRAFT_666900 [Dendrothele bispora CBS 962.96]|uniref:Aminoglycoside phosphotransferase domain-containing protein n=1 Tax=Dendrothele bispora (strain CBS 962.96) TaxID=1314807 RepID=A0A4S8M0V6_DENBC|nr:hypothetical protein K435DRAFT_666900 [Dendrothele bispora CBS 962.96]